MSELRVTNFAGAPTAYRALRNVAAAAPADLAVRCLPSAGEPLDPGVMGCAPAATRTATSISPRATTTILMAGYRIGPFEVESTLVAHPAVAEAAVTDAPDELRGEVLDAFVALCEGHAGSDELAEELKQHVKANYAAHAYPPGVHFVDALPKAPSGKIQRYVLRERRAAGAA
jgi:acyl-coenzyme A synthetase/AMP-(fatty) acid ligase